MQQKQLQPKMEQNYNESKITENPTSNLLLLQAKPRKIKKDTRIKIDISKTEYPLLRNVPTNEMGWKIWTRQQSKQEINVYWMDTYVPQEHFKRMKSYQRVNHFPASQNLGKKNLLTFNLNRMKKIMPKQYSYYPQTFNFPTEIEQFQKFAKEKQENYFIVKPTCDSQGRGIYITRTVDINVKEELVVQEYIDNPLLIEGMKFDLRIYVLLKSIFPLKIFVYEEGLSRLATCSYEKPTSNNNKNMRMHLTNYAINKFSPNFIFNKSEEEDNVGHKRSYSATMKAIQKLGCDVAHLQTQIDKIIVKTIMSTYQPLEKKYKQVRDTREQTESICFQLLGFDILIKQNFQPFLLEVNHSPSFSTDSPLDLIIKKHLILDTLNMLSLNHEQKINYFKNKNDHDSLYSCIQSSRNNRSISHQGEQLGAFRKLYPLDNLNDNEDLNKLYEQIFKNSKIQKHVRMKYIFPHYNKPMEEKIQSPIIASYHNPQSQQKQKPFTLYNVINSLKINRLRKSQLFNHQNQQASIQKTNIFQSEINADSIRKQQLLSYERKIRKDKEKQRKKYILPMPLNSINIKLDEKFIHSKRQAKSTHTHYFSPDPNYFKVHSLFNRASPQVESERNKEKGNQTADVEARKFNNFESFRRTQLPAFSHLIDDNNYSVQLKQKLERMQFARLRIQKSRKLQAGNSMIVKNKSTQKRNHQFLMSHDQKNY